MKKIIITSMVGAFLFLGCSSKNDSLKPNACIIENQEAPIWVCAPRDVNGYLTAVGSAQKSPLGFSFQKTEAMAAARDELARRISLKVKNVFKRFERNTGVNVESEKVVENVSKQLANVTLRNSKIITTWQSKNGTLYVLVGVPKKNLEEGIKDSPLYKAYLKKVAKEEWQKLDQEIKSEFEE